MLPVFRLLEPTSNGVFCLSHLQARRRDATGNAQNRHFEKHLPLALYGGAFKSDDGETGIGNKLVLNCHNRDEAMNFLDGDPFQRNKDILESDRVQRMDVVIRDDNFEIR